MVIGAHRAACFPPSISEFSTPTEDDDDLPALPPTIALEEETEAREAAIEAVKQREASPFLPYQNERPNPNSKMLFSKGMPN